MQMSEWGEGIRNHILDLENRTYLDIRQIYEKDVLNARDTTTQDRAGREYAFDEEIGLYRHEDSAGKIWLMPPASQVPGWWGNCPECQAAHPLPHYLMGTQVQCRECRATFVATLPEGIPTYDEIKRDSPTNADEGGSVGE